MKTIQFETFRQLGGYHQCQLTEKQPSCFNGNVSIRKYRVTFELVDEPKEVLRERLLKLWKECENHHHWIPLQRAAKELGMELPDL